MERVKLYSFFGSLSCFVMAHLQPCGYAYVIETLTKSDINSNSQCEPVVSGWKQLKYPYHKLCCGSVKQFESRCEGSRHSKKQSAKAIPLPWPRHEIILSLVRRKRKLSTPTQVHHFSCPLPIGLILQSFRRFCSQFRSHSSS